MLSLYSNKVNSFVIQHLVDPYLNDYYSVVFYQYNCKIYLKKLFFLKKLVYNHLAIF